MYSFYGGRPGNSFVIITTFKSVNDMVTAFKKGPDYKTVHYDEYVMINTDNKNNLENGRLYRRGYQFTNSMGGAEYIGTIVGPSGNAPQLTIETIDEVKAKNVPDGYSGKSQNGEYSISNSALVPGKTKDVDGNDVYNDSIKWASCSIVNENNEEATAYLGFTFPYPVIEFLTESVKPYLGGSYADTLSISRDDEMNHPFYERWNIRIPKGIKGDAFKNFRVITASNNDGVQQYDGQPDDRSGSREILVYDYYNYDKKENGNPKTLYLGDYNMIEGISMSNDGAITVQYTHNNDVTFSEKVKWINSISLLDNGTFTITYNTKTNGVNDKYSTSLDWIKGVDIAQDGTVTFIHNDHSDNFNHVDTYDKIIKWCNGVSINDQGVITFNWNDESSTQLQEPIQWIDEVALDTNGTLTVTYNTSDENNPLENKKEIFSNKIKWIDDIELSNTGTLTITYNTLNEESEENPKPQEQSIFQNAIKSITSINHAVDENSLVGHKGRLYINYNDGSADSIALDSLSNITMNQETGEITTEWNNDENLTEQLGSINFIKDLTIDTSGTLLVKYSNLSGGVTLDNDPGWFSLGKVAPYGNNTSMTVSRILRGKHFIDTDSKTYLQFYVENIGLVRLTDTVTISSGTAVFYYNGTQVGSELALANTPIISQASNAVGTNTLNTLNFKIELDDSIYPVTPTNSSPHLVDIELKDVVINVARSNTADRIADLQDQQVQQKIDQNTNNINSLIQTVTQMNNNISSINNNITNLNTRSEFKTLQIKNSNSQFNNTNFYIIGTGGMNVYYNEYFAIIKGRITTAKTLTAGSTYYDMLNLSGKIPHKFKTVGSSSSVQFTAITEGHSGRDFYIIDGCKIKWKDANYGWGKGATYANGSWSISNWNEAVQIDVVIPFDLSTSSP